MPDYKPRQLRMALQLGLMTSAFVQLATAPASALLVCKVNADAKNVPLYDRPGGAELRRVDVDPTWKGGPGMTAHQTGGQIMEMWIEVKDKTDGVVGFFKLGDGGAGCSGGL